VHNNGSIETPEITHPGIHFLLADIDVYSYRPSFIN